MRLWELLVLPVLLVELGVLVVPASGEGVGAGCESTALIREWPS